MHELIEERTAPDSRRSYTTRTVSGVPSCVNRFRMAARTCNSATWRSKSRAMTRSPINLTHRILGVDLPEQTRQHRRIAHRVGRDLDGANLQRVCVDPYVQLAPLASVLGPVLSTGIVLSWL